jgi:hypothetical protein
MGETTTVKLILYCTDNTSHIQDLRGYSYASDNEFAHCVLKVQSHIVSAWFHTNPGAQDCFTGLPLTHM